MGEPPVRAELELADGSTIAASIPATVPYWTRRRELTVRVTAACGRLWMQRVCDVGWYTGERPGELRIFRLTDASFAIACNMEDAEIPNHRYGHPSGGTSTPLWIVRLRPQLMFGIEVEFTVRMCRTWIKGCWVSDIAGFGDGKYVVCCLFYPYKYGHDMCTFVECYEVLTNLALVTDLRLLNICWRAVMPPVPNSFPTTPREIALHRKDGKATSFDIMAGSEKELEGVLLSSEGLEFEDEMPARCYWQSAFVVSRERYMERAISENECECRVYGLSAMHTARIKAVVHSALAV